MKNLIFIFFALCSLTVFSQSEGSGGASNHKRNIGLFIAPDYNSLIMGNPIGQEKVKPEIGFSAGFEFEVRLSEKTTFRTGIGYGKKSYHHTQSGMIFGTDIDPVLGVISESKIESDISFSEIQIPLLLKQKMSNPRFFFAGGLEITYPFSNHSEQMIYYGNGTQEKMSNSKDQFFNFAPVLSFGYSLPVSNKSSISIEPMFKYYVKEYLVLESRLCNYGLRVTFDFGM
jgi:hypothetical protein